MQSQMGLKAAPWRHQIGGREDDDCFPTPLLDHICHLLREHLSWHHICTVEREEVGDVDEGREEMDKGEGEWESEVGRGRDEVGEVE